MRHLLVTSTWFALGCLLTAVIADTMQRRAEAAQTIDDTMARQTYQPRFQEIAELPRAPVAGNERVRPKMR